MSVKELQNILCAMASINTEIEKCNDNEKLSQLDKKYKKYMKILKSLQM